MINSAKSMGRVEAFCEADNIGKISCSRRPMASITLPNYIHVTGGYDRAKCIKNFDKYGILMGKSSVFKAFKMRILISRE